MSRPPSPTKLDVQRIRIDAEGYDRDGSYWGAGHDVFIIATADGAEEVTVRARNVAEARQKAALELARAPGDIPDTNREPLGGASRHVSRFEIDWHDPAAGKRLRIRISQSRDYLVLGQDHLEIESIAPAKAPLPITETGYRSHFLSGLELAQAGGAVAFVTAWLDREAAGKNWQAKAHARAQGDLFQWADAAREVGKRNTKAARPKAPVAKSKASRRRPSPT